MKVLLINPSLTQENISHYKPAVEKARGRYPALGLLFIAGVLEKEHHVVKVIDIDVEKDSQKNLPKLVGEFKPDVAGVHVMTWTFHQAKEIASFIKEISPSTILIAGGAAVTSSPQAILKYSVFDYGVIGEGEETIVELIDAIKFGRKIDSIHGIVFRKGEGIVQNKNRHFLRRLDEVPFPARHLVRLDRYYDVFARKNGMATMITSRGCPYRCVYCDRDNRMGNVWRSYSNKRIIEELKELKYRYKIMEVMFFDDEFIIDRNKLLELCNMIMKEGLKIIWECRARVDMVDKELLSAMKKSGCYRIRFGFESGDDGILKVLKKDITVKRSLECARMTKEAGIEIFGYFMMGCPGETKETLQKTLELALQIDPDFAVFSKVILIPGSELFDWAVSEKLIDSDYWELFFKGEAVNTAPSISTDILSEKEVDEFVDYANKKFYLRRKFIIKRLLNIKSVPQLRRQLAMAHSLLSG